MEMKTKVRMLIAAREMKMNELANKMEPPTSAQNLSAKMKRGNFSENELQAIAKACDATFEGFFTLNDTGKTF